MTANWTYKIKNTKYTYSFSKEDINHNIRIYKKYNIQPETLNHVSIDFLLQKEKLIRYIIKELDILLKVNGTFEILIYDSKSHSAYFRSRDQIKYEFSLATNGRYKLEDVFFDGKYLKLKYIKSQTILLDSDDINLWSFGIITNGLKLNLINNLIHTIYNQNIPNFEIIICGPYPKDQEVDYSKIKIIDDVVIKGDIRFPLSAKKNKIIDTASFQNICLLHDRFFLPATWFDRMNDYGNFFDYLCMPTVDKFNNRYLVDWMTFVSPLTRRLTYNGPLKYTDWSEDLIIQGGIIIGKKSLLSRHKLDERLYWEEMEDLHFSKLAFLDGAFFYIDQLNHVYSESVNHSPDKKNKYLFIFKTKLNWVLSILKSFIKYNYFIRKYKE